jgi:hypothetical protein
MIENFKIIKNKLILGFNFNGLKGIINPKTTLFVLAHLQTLTIISSTLIWILCFVGFRVSNLEFCSV